jgi:hypothetical protein
MASIIVYEPEVCDISIHDAEIEVPVWPLTSRFDRFDHGISLASTVFSLSGFMVLAY